MSVPYNKPHEARVEVSEVRRQLKHAIDRAKAQAQQRRQQVADAERAYAKFLEDVATPTTRMVANALKAEGYPFTVSTPSGGLRLASDRGRDDYVEFELDGAGAKPTVIGRIRRTRGSRTLEDERPIKAGAAPEDLTDADVLGFLVEALLPWLDR
jgi:phosphoglycolate phosphatase-like HAD superfamily hydrolase